MILFDPFFLLFGPFSDLFLLLSAFTDKVIKNHRAVRAAAATSPTSPTRRKVFLDILLDAVDVGDEDSRTLTDADLRHEVDTFMFAGHDTTSSGLSWAIWLVGRHPKVQEKLHEELDELIDDPVNFNITHTMANSFKYLDMVIKETLRLYPPAPFFARTLSFDTVLGDTLIPKGTTVSVNTSMLHRNPHYWERPLEFDPERFGPDAPPRDPYQYIPFSVGSRNCIGQKFAQTELKVVLAKFFRRFSVKSVDSENRASVDVIMRASRGVNVILTPRKAKYE